jgi:2',3'-cyclic-nucleotide 2'-phosphodiesterase (5'-nucleotidase family)
MLTGVVGLASRVQRSQLREVTILYTNDFHSAFDPIPAYWLKRSPKLGGAAQLSTFINQIRKCDKTVFLFDTGDMFTGMLSNLTRGEALMEMMGGMKYDAMAIGNHEFDYGSDNFEKQMYRVPFPVLGANIFYKGTTHDNQKTYKVATSSFLAEGGDLYQTFLRTRQSDTKKPLSEVIIEYFKKYGEIQAPRLGRLVKIHNARQN